MWMTPDTEITSHRHRAGHHRTIWLLTNCEGGERWWRGSTAGVTCEFSVEANCAVGGRRAYCGPLTSNLVNNSRSTDRTYVGLSAPTFHCGVINTPSGVVVTRYAGHQPVTQRRSKGGGGGGGGGGGLWTSRGDT